MYDHILEIFDVVIQYAVLLIELVGVAVILVAVVRAVLGLIRRNPAVRLELAEGIALALEFKLGGELLRTLTVRDWEELLILGAVIILRAAMTFLIQWEIRIEKKNEMEKRELEGKQ